MTKRVIYISLILLVASITLAADKAVGPSSSGNGSGDDWSNIAQWSSITLVRGNTYYLQDGTYGSKTLNIVASGSSYIYIKKATESAHGPSTGWSSTYGDGTATFSGGAYLTVTTDYWDIDGVTGGGPGSWKSGHGIVFTSTAGTDATYINASDTSYVFIRHIEFNQIGDTTAYSTMTSGVFTSSGSASFSNSTVEYCYFENLGGLPFFMRAGTTNIFQYNYTGDVCGASVFNADNHCEVIVTHDMDDVHWRWNYHAECPSTGCFVSNSGASTDVRIYGNVFNGSNPISCNNAAGNNDWRIFNNTFVGAKQGFTQGDCGHSGWMEYNNVAYDHEGSALWDTRDYQWYSQTSNLSYTMGFGANTNCTDQPGTCPETDDPFIDSSGDEPEDFQLSAALSGYDGTDSCVLDACTGEKKYNIDMFGNTRGADGTWDRGAIEYDANPTTPANAITGVNIN